MASSTALRVYGRHRATVGVHGSNNPLRRTSARFVVPYHFSRYWARKAVDPLFHIGDLGGARHCSYTTQEEALLCTLLLQEVKANPLRTHEQFALALVSMIQFAVALLTKCASYFTCAFLL